MKYEEGLLYVEIAAALEIEVKSVTQRLRKARQRLKQELRRLGIQVSERKPTHEKPTTPIVPVRRLEVNQKAALGGRRNRDAVSETGLSHGFLGL